MAVSKTLAEQDSVHADLFSVGQIRLAQISLFNWGSFNGLHNASINPDGTLITGDNGSGKSTLIDGLMALLLPAGRASFNVAAAQGDKSDRNLISYMRGSYGTEHDGASTRVKSKREGAVVTALRALYRGDDGSEITLAAVFWTAQASNNLADVKRVYIVAKRNLALKELLDAFGEGNSRSLKQWLKEDPTITNCDDSFPTYQELYRKLLFMHNKNAPALLSRALGLKKIDDLTALIRELVLEPSNVREDAKKVVDEFTDLVAVHHQLLDARAQQNHLERLPELDQKIKACIFKSEHLQQQKEALPLYFARIESQLLQQRIKLLEQKLAHIQLAIKQLSEKEGAADKRVESSHAHYIKAGGGRIESLKNELEQTKTELNRVIKRSASYQKITQSLNINHELIESEFIKNQALIESELSLIETEKEVVQNKFGEISGALSNIFARKKQLSEEIKSLSQRADSNIDEPYQKLRDLIVDALDLKKQQCVFIAELLDVKKEETPWQGAIERALGGLRTTLLVPEDCFSMVTAWLNSQHTGLHVRVQVVRELPNKQQAQFKTDGYLRKLAWKEHPYREWVKHHLARFDLHCVATTQALDNTPFSMTQQGLMHKEKGRFEKKDQHKIDNRRLWCLGFSNTSKLLILKQDLLDEEERYTQTGALVLVARQQLDAVAKQEKYWGELSHFEWTDINSPYWQQKLEQLKLDINALEKAGNELDKAQKLWQQAKLALKDIRQDKDGQLSELGKMEKTLSDTEAQFKRAKGLAVKTIDEAVEQSLKKRVKQIEQLQLNQLTTLIEQYFKSLEQDLEKSRSAKARAGNSAIGIMSSFRSHERWTVIAAEWGADLNSLDEYIEHLNELEAEGLPQLVEQFIERLNKHATQSLVRIVSRLDSEREDIEERIDTINQVLQRTEFKQGSHLKLGSSVEKFPHVIEFNQHVKKVLSQVNSDDHEARYKQLEHVIVILEKASNASSAGTLESLRLLDPRHQLSFYAEEIDTKSGAVRDVLKSSSGKSGGEKEAFAGTIVAASLAYVLTPEGFDKPVYCTVFLDEAFSNTAEAVSRRVLRVFKELHIHVNLITPYKNLNLARESAQSLLIAERDQERHESHLCEVTWEEIDRQIAQQKLLHEAAELGVELEHK